MLGINCIQKSLVHILAALLTILCSSLLAAPAQAQCEPQWQPFDASTASFPGVEGKVNATVLWDQDGPGPITPKIVIGGEFSFAGNVPVLNIAMYDTETGNWSRLGSGLAGAVGTNGVNALAVLPNGDLIAAGLFITAGGVSANYIARWNGSSWSSLGSGMNNLVNALVVHPNGDLIAGGRFTSAGGRAVGRIARWNGSTWSALGSGLSADPYQGSVYALAVHPNGDLIAGGYFTIAGGLGAGRIARWNGSSWSAIGSGVNNIVRAIAVLPNGDIIAGGQFDFAGVVAARRIARWNGSSWTALGSGMNSDVNAIAVLPNGNLIVGGSFTNAGDVAANYVARWDGASWSEMGSGMSHPTYSLAVLPHGDLIAGGNFTSAGGVTASGLARWDGSSWSAINSGINNITQTFTVLSNGDLLAGGSFTTMGGVEANSIARWNGSSWSALDGGMNSMVHALAVLPNGDIVAGGDFTTAGGEPANRIARWNGLSWSAFGSTLSSGMNSTVQALAVLPNGDLVAGGDFTTAGGEPANRIARWNGSSWSALDGGMNSTVRALAVLPNGDIVAGGTFTAAGGVAADRIARWNGSSWSALGSGVTGGSIAAVNSLVVLPNGDLIAGGFFGSAGGVAARDIARWDGSSWSALGSGLTYIVSSLLILPSGDIIAGGSFTAAGGVGASRMARWNGSSWSALGSGVNNSGDISYVSALAVLPSGDLVAGGFFKFAGSVVTPYLARYSSVPGVALQPLPKSLAVGQTLTLSTIATSTLTDVSVEWLRNGVPIINGPGGASSGGGTVSGAFGPLPSPTDGTLTTLTITNAQSSDSGQYTAVFANPCGSITTAAATVIVNTPYCPVDFNQDGGIDGADVEAFFLAWQAGEPQADMNEDGGVDGVDIEEFFLVWETGEC